MTISRHLANQRTLVLDSKRNGRELYKLFPLEPHTTILTITRVKTTIVRFSYKHPWFAYSIKGRTALFKR